MTDRDESSKGFLDRWSRKKIDAERETPAPARTDTEDALPVDEVRRPDRKTTGEAEGPAPAAPKAEFDLASLPSLDSITAATDVRAFLTPGVPADLARAALRRAWAADPTIRDFVGLADYAWDFHAPGAMAGFGPLEMTDELRREIVGMLTRGQSRETSNEDPASTPRRCSPRREAAGAGAARGRWRSPPPEE